MGLLFLPPAWHTAQNTLRRMSYLSKSLIGAQGGRMTYVSKQASGLWEIWSSNIPSWLCVRRQTVWPPHVSRGQWPSYPRCCAECFTFISPCSITITVGWGYRPPLFTWALLYCASQTLHFLQTEVCGNPALVKRSVPFFQQAQRMVSDF